MQVLDTTVLSNFARIERPDLLRLALGRKDSTTTIVRAELEVGESLGRIPVINWRWLPIVELSLEETGLFEELAQGLGRGEASCIAIAIVRQATVLTDDQAARQYARSMGVAVSGTLGALRALIKNGNLTPTEADNLLTAMIERGYRSPVRSLREIRS